MTTHKSEKKEIFLRFFCDFFSLSLSPLTGAHMVCAGKRRKAQSVHHENGAEGDDGSRHAHEREQQRAH
jgi:hypothetical protein